MMSSTEISSPASTVFVSKIKATGKIYTVNDKQPWTEAVVIEDKKIAYVGDNEGAMAYAKDDVTRFKI